MIAIEATVSFQIAMALRAHRNLMAAALSQLEPPLYVGQELVLGQLWHEDGVNQAVLAGRVGIDASTMTKALQRLERYGLVQRTPDPHDTRASLVFLTPAGRALEPPINAIWQALEQRTLAGFTTDEAALLAQLLKRIARNLT